MTSAEPQTVTASPGPADALISRRIVALCLLVLFAGLWDHDLWTPDEPREAAIALEMSRSGDLIVPRLAGEPFVEKPPLAYIAGAGMLRLFGDILGPVKALRLLSALWGLGSILMVYLMGLRLLGRERAWIPALIMATMPGFVMLSHRILTDNALLFFVTAACWALLEAYEGGRIKCLAMAGLFAAGAFWVKGIVGVLIIGLAWLGLFVPWMARRRNAPAETPHDGTLLWHGVGLAVFLAAIGFWMRKFYVQGGPELWKEWFWMNHFGRFSGTAETLGHHRKPLYYLPIVPLMILPWLAAFISGLKRLAAFTRDPSFSWSWFLWLWGIGGLVLLSLSATKRDIYLCVLYPAWALMTALALRDTIQTWVRRAMEFWSLLCALGFVVVGALPWLIRLLETLLKADWGVLSGIGFLEWKTALLLSIVGLGVSLMLYRIRRRRLLAGFLAATAFFYLVALAVLHPALDRLKSYQEAFRASAAAVIENGASRTALWNADETTRAGLYVYANMILPELPDADALRKVMQGQDNRYKLILVLGKKDRKKEAMFSGGRIVFEAPMGPRRILRLIAAEPPMR
ncbi:MAG: glycosyltransferase family 39 protein [Lentisphaerae bacterium]|nr:glycosyltransferase family 39 protein [Lentisphaerota bacterium]